MQRARIPLTNFQYGEISPSLTSRTDSAIYNSSAQKVKNFFLMSEGGVQKRGGFKALHEFTGVTVDSTKTQQVRIIPFIFSDDEQYIAALSDEQVDMFFINPTTGAVTKVDTLTQDVNTNTLPWTEQYLHEITFAQAGDIMFLCHPTFRTQQLVRTGLSTFQVEKFEFTEQAGGARIYQPYYPFQASGVTLDPSASSGQDITLTTSANYWDQGTTTTDDVAAGSFVTDSYYKITAVGTTDFTAVGANSSTVGEIFKATGAGSGTGTADLITKPKHIGTRIRYHGAEIRIDHVRTETVAVGDVIDELYVSLDANALRTIDNSSTVEITHVDHGMEKDDVIIIRNATTVGGINEGQINGTRTITGVIDENRYTFTAGATANASEDGGGIVEIVTHAPTKQWAEQSYSDLRGYPAAVGFHEGRLWFGGTSSQPDTVWASKSGLYYNFDLGDALADDSIELVMSIGEVATIRHFVSNRDIHIFTAGSEFYIPSFQNEPITPTNARVQRQTSFGSTFARPQPFYGATLFVQQSGTAVRQFVYSDSEAAYKADPISLLSSHLISNPIQSSVTISDVGASDAAVFFLNDDGSLVTYNLNRLENIAGWTQFETEGSFHSITSVSDKLFTVINADLGSGTNSLVLCELDATLNMDCANEYTGSAGVFDVSDFFDDGAVVSVVADTDYLGEFTVASGNVDVSSVDATLTSCEVGYVYDVELKTNPLDVGTAIGPETGQPRTIGRVILDLYDSLSVSVNDKKLIIRRVNSDFSLARQPFTGKKDFYLLGYNKDPQVTITQTAPLKLQINGLIAEVSF